MNWFFIAIVVFLLFKAPAFSIVGAIAYAIYWFIRNSSEPVNHENKPSNQTRTHNSSALSAGDLADLVLLRLELQALVKRGVIDSEQQAEITQRIDALCTQHLANLAAVRNNDLWRKRRDIAWELLDKYADTPLGLPPWRFAKPQNVDSIVTAQPDFSEPITPPVLNEAQTIYNNDYDYRFKRPITPTPNEAQTASFATETEADLKPTEQIANFTVAEIPIPDTPLANESQAADFSVSSEASATFTLPEIQLPVTPLANELTQATPASLIIETDFSTSINPFAADKNNDATISEQVATFAIDETDHSLAPPHQAAIPKAKKSEPTLNQYAWKPHEPSRLERVLKTVSGWHSMAVPFLAQNIGWFIGVFCFIAGSMFLVHYSQGYASNLIAFFALFIFTLALLFGGYRLRHKRPELEVSSYVIFILSLLLIPLTNITGTKLLISGDTLGLKLFSSLLVFAELGVFYVAVTLVSGLMDRSLQQGLPKFFLALTATQLLQALLLSLPSSWQTQVLVISHLLIFALLSKGIYLFANQWLHSIFIDRHKISCVAAGTLIYAAVVSFVFITIGNSIPLPAGYYGFFLMLLCLLLFFIDTQLKQWTEQYTYLSRFSFLVYGLSILALCLVAQHPIAIPTLVLAIAIYAYIVWCYLTLTPLTILLVCYFWLYGSLVLQHLPDSWHFLASLPVLLSLYKTAQWALNKRQSAYLALIVYRVLYGLLAMLTAWSLSHSEHGLLAMTTTITAGMLLYYALKSAPVAIFTPYSIIDTVSINRYQNLLNSHWFYTIPVLGAVTVFYTPPLIGEAQFSFGLLLLAVFWTYQGLHTFFKAHSTSETTPIEQYLNSALLSVLVGVLPLWMMPENVQRVAPLFLAGIIMLWLSYQLLARWLFYLALLVCTLAYLPLKALYFQTPSGLATMLMGIGIWCWLWFIERQESSELMTLKREQVTQKIALLPSCRLLGRYRLPSPTLLFRDVINAPLEQVMCLLWLLGMTTLVSRLLGNQLSYPWLTAIFFAGLFSLLLIARYLLIKLLPVPIALVLSAVLMMLKFWGLNTDGLLLASGLFALGFWQVVNYSLTQAFFIKLINTLNPALPNEIQQIGKITHHTAFFIVLVSVILQLLNAADTHSFIVLLTLITTAGFLWLSNSVYQQLIVRYWVLGFSVLAGIELVSLTLHPFAWQALTTDSYAAILFTLLSLAVGVLVLTPTTTYTKPAAVIAISLVFAGIFLQIQHVINLAGSVITPLDYIVLFLASVSLLLANVKHRWIFCHFSAFMIFALAILCLENSVFHAQQPFNLWLGTQTFPDLWLTLGLLSLAMSLLSHNLRFTQKVDVCYLPPLNTAATISFAWALLGTLTLFFAHKPELLAWSFACLLLALFSLTKNRTGAEQIRGFASATFLTLIVFSLLPSFSQTATVIMGYALWCCASFVLPSFNKRFSDWAIAPIFFPYLGLLLIVFSCFWMPLFNEFSAGIYCLELSVYSLLMLRYSRGMVFSWLATLTFTAAVLWLENSLIHTNQSLNLSFGKQTIADSWLVLGLLSLAMSALSHKLKATQKWAELHCLPLNTVATLNFVWSLLGTLTAFFVSKDSSALLAGSFVCLLLALFSLSKNRSGEAESRGFGSACLLTLTAFSLLRVVGLDGFELQSATASLGYALWLFASFALPPFNKRYRDWTIEPLFFPYLGFLLVAFSSCWQFTGIYCLELSIYCVLMLRYSRWTGFAWIASFAFAGAVLCLEHSFVHANQPFDLPINVQNFTDLWLVLGLLSLLMSLLSHGLKSAQKWADLYCFPLSAVATLCFNGSLFGTLTLFFISVGSVGQADWLASLLLVLLLAVFSLSKDSANAASTRGFASACLLSLCAFSLLPESLDNFALQQATVLFGYTLWLFATLLLPHFNKRYPTWTIAPNFFPWLGLLLVSFSGCWWQQEFIAVAVGTYCLTLSVYCLLMLRYSGEVIFCWLSAFAFTATGIAFNFDNEQLPVNLLLWSNLQLLLVTLWQRKGEKLAERWQWQQTSLATAFAVTTQFILLSYLLITTVVLFVALIDGVDLQAGALLELLPIGILLSLSFLHLLWIRFSTFFLHSFIHTLFLLVWMVYFTRLTELFHPPLLLALWSVVLLGGIRIIQPTRYQQEIGTALTHWLTVSVCFATLVLLMYSQDTLGELMLSLAIVTGLSAALGWWSGRSIWLMIASIELLLLLHGWPFLLVGYAMRIQLLPWYALQTVLFASLSSWLIQVLSANSENTEYDDLYKGVQTYSALLISLSLLELGAHGYWVMANMPPQWIIPPFDAIAALSAGVIISIIGIRRIRHTLDSSWLYSIVALIGALVFYGRLLWLGVDSVTLWDTAGLIGSAYILFFLQGLFPSKPLYNMALLMPVLALFTVLHLEKSETSMTLIVTGLLYVMMRRHSQQKIPLYLALLAFNAGVYLWIPSLAKDSQLYQVYVIPAALSVLMLLHLHSRELKPSVLMGSRLAAISSIYACATADVFLRDQQNIIVFILAMGLSIAGILLGIALRTRAFLYAGVSFLLLNVIGQALLFYSKQGLEPLNIAIVLMVMGAAILGFMYWFEDKKVAILQRINVIQAEMQTWE
ncbi:MAG: hypothetical protein WCK96_05030 [Methylococcales bacterium]